MHPKYSVVTALGAALLVTACDTALLREGQAVTRNVGFPTLGKTAPAVPEGPQVIPVAWEVLASPVSIARDDPAAPKGSASRVGGHAVLKAAPHRVPQRYRVSWSGLRDSQATTPTRLTLRDPDGDRAIVLQFEGDRLRVINGDEDVFPYLTFSPTKTHYVTLVLTTGPRPTVAIDIRQGKIPHYATPPVITLDKGFDSVGALEIEVAAEGTAYHIADFEAVPTKG